MQYFTVPVREKKETYIVDTDDDFVYMIEQAIGYDAGKYVNEIIDERDSNICDYERLEELEEMEDNRLYRDRSFCHLGDKMIFDFERM